ncbi:MAG TPA: YbaB/EbfC family nucleoid-associated protein [Gammaproteobacteria bacterium]|nr:YbaB/EbfC family nucleoid-associated protein [Gammaproteobacteria bacterium]
MSMRGGLGNMMKQAQQLQENMRRAQEELERLEVLGQAGGGKVTVTMTGKHVVRRVQIAPELLGGDAEMLEDLVTVACNDAASKVEEAMRERFSNLGLPAGLKLPF